MYNRRLADFFSAVKSIFCCPLAEIHLPGVLALDQTCFGGLWSEAGYRREMTSPNSDLRVLLRAVPIDSPPSTVTVPLSPAAIGSDAIGTQPTPVTVVGLGCYWAILDEAHITLLAIAPDHRRQGFGRGVLLQLLASARQRGLERATLEVRASNHTALALYESLGFRTAGRRRRYYSDGEDALILWQRGLQTPDMGTTLHQWQQTHRDRLTPLGWHWVNGHPRQTVNLQPESPRDPQAQTVR